MSGVMMRRGVTRTDRGAAAPDEHPARPSAGPDVGASAQGPRVVAGGWRVGAGEAVLLVLCAVAAAFACFAGFRWQPQLVDASARSGVETVVGLTALLTSGLLVLQLRVRHHMPDLLLLSALISVALVDIVFTSLPAVTGLHSLPYGSDARMALGAIIPVAFVVAAFSSRSSLTVRAAWHVGLIAAACLLIFSGVEVLDAVTGRIVGQTDVPRWLTDWLGAGEALGYVVAGAAFTVWNVQSSRGGLLASACLLLAGARIYVIAMPTQPVGTLTLRDPLRLAAYGFLLIAVASDWIALERSRQDEAVRAERERIARDIHDGLAQDLATIALHAQLLQSRDGTVHPLTVAARRALAISRNTIIDLSAAHSPTTLAALRAVGDELEARFGIEVTVIDRVRGDAGGCADLGPRAREQTVRIAREAIVNAARHVEVSLRGGGARWSLRVTDDGSGIPDAVVHGAHGFGLGVMRARARELDGELVARRRSLGGTVIEVSMPLGAPE